MNEQRNLFLAIVLMMAVLFGWQYLVAVPRMQEEQAKLADQKKTEMPLAPGVSSPQAVPSVVLAQRRARAISFARHDRNADARWLDQPHGRALRRPSPAPIPRDARS